MLKVIYLAAMLLLLALFFRSEVMSVVAIALVMGVWLSRFWLRRVERGLRVSREVPEMLAFGEEATVAVVLNNRSLLRIPWLEIRESVPFPLRMATPAPMVVSIGAGAEHRVTYPIRGSRRGWYGLGPARMVLGDVLGLGVVRLQGPVAHLTVYPLVLPLSALGLPASLAYGPLRPWGIAQRIEDPSRPAGVRQYVPGDDVRRLDWKSSARRDTLLVRRADPTIAPETTLALAFGKGDYPQQAAQDALERAAIVAASMATALLQRKLPVGLVTNGVDPLSVQQGVKVGFGKGDAHRRVLLGTLGRLSSGSEGELLALLQTHPLPWGGTVILIIADLTMELLPQIVALRMRGQQVALVLVEGRPSGLALARQQRFPVYVVDRRGLPHAERSR